MKAKVNYNAIDTWLEPVIGYIYDVTKIGKTYIKFMYSPIGELSKNRKFTEIKYDINCFDLIP